MDDPMTILSPAVWSSSRRLARVRPAPAGDGRADVALRRRLGWAAPAGAAFAGLVAAMGAAFGDRPGAFAALAVAAAMAMAALLLRGLTSGILLRLSAAVTEADALRAELATVRQTNEAFRDLAHHDSLTGLPNRGLLYDRLGVAIAHAHRQTSHLALLFLDLNDFKSVNDSFGHGFGDRLLVELANRIRGSVRAGDTVARLGGDEFVVLLDTVTGAEDAACVAAKVRHVVRAPYRLDGHEVPIAASIGMSVYPGDGTTADELMRSADAAMYRDKQREAELRALAARKNMGWRHRPGSSRSARASAASHEE
jgi:diguanylate cyclase (GGDEF)-like protein